MRNKTITILTADNAEIFIFGIISSMVFSLIHSNFSTWLSNIGVSKTEIGFISLFSMPYALRFIWSSEISKYKIPILSRLFGNHKSWVFIITIMISFTTLILFFIDLDSDNIYFFSVFVFIYSVFGALQVSLIDCYRINKFSYKQQSIVSSFYMTGYKTGIILASGFLLILVDYLCKMFGLCDASINWKISYLILSLLMVFFSLINLLFFPKFSLNIDDYGKRIFCIQKMKSAVLSVLSVKGGIYLLCFVTIYRIPDAFISNMINIFFLDRGYSLSEIGFYWKIIGFITNILGLLLGGYLSTITNDKTFLMIGAILQMISNIFFVYMANNINNDIITLCITIFVENICAGVATCCIVSYIAKKCKIYVNPAASYAFIESFYRLFEIFINLFSGIYADNFSWISFYIFSMCLGLIPLFMILKLK
ncbi:AmpG family muropeptide MFS transporter [Anaplasmataceae bacterium AB001_6]|nr:AmpG family muropeptide MFS transporter [Anaplasmataceae bacterium AB001_6]